MFMEDKKIDLVIYCTVCGKEVFRKNDISMKEYEDTNTFNFTCPNDSWHILKKINGKDCDKP